MRWRTVGALLLLVGFSLIFGVARSSAAGGVTVVAHVDGQTVGGSSQNQPVKLFPRQDSVLAITVTNDSSSPIDVAEVRLAGRVIGLTFFSYDTAVNLPVAAGASATQRLAVDLSGLSGQATGLIPGSVQVVDSHHHVLASQDGVVDVRGSLRSVYGLFGLGVAFLTALSFLGALVGLARHRLPANRWRRGLRFLTPGLGLGLVINFTLSATRVFVPQLDRWVGITVVSALVLFGLGYLTPTPDLQEPEPEEAPTRVVDEVTLVAIAARPGYPALDAQPARPQLAAEPSAPVLDWRAPEQLPAAVVPAEAHGPQSRDTLQPASGAPVWDSAAPSAAVPPADTPPSPAPDPRATLPVGFTPVVGPPVAPDDTTRPTPPPA